jgi:hypothetical protein
LLVVSPKKSESHFSASRCWAYLACATIRRPAIVYAVLHLEIGGYELRLGVVLGEISTT